MVLDDAEAPRALNRQQLLTLIVIPTVYEILDEWKEWVMLKVFKRAPGHRPELAAEPGD